MTTKTTTDTSEHTVGRNRSPPSRARKAVVRKTKPPETKKAKLIALLKAKGGKDVAELSKILGWQQHTTRAALTGLRKAGYAIEREVPEGGGAACYRIASQPNAAAAG